MYAPTRFVSIALFSALFVAGFSAAAAAQNVPMVHVVREDAEVRSRPGTDGEVLARATRGAMLETIDMQDDWYWVVLPRDDNGTRRGGWVRARDVEVVGFGEYRTTLRHFTEAAAKAKAEADAAAAEQDARIEKARDQVEAARAELDAVQDSALEKARQEVEQARREYEALVQEKPAAAATSPASASAAPTKSATPKTTPKVNRKAAPSTQKTQDGSVSIGREYALSGGYSFYRDQTGGMNFPAGWAIGVEHPLSLRGFGASAISPRLDIVGEVNGSHRSTSLLDGTSAGASLFTFAAGPKYSRQRGNVTTFAQALVGVGISRATAAGISDSSAGFALQPGVGVDYPITKTLALRVGADLAFVHDAQWFKGFRITTGLRFPIGSRTQR